MSRFSSWLILSYQHFDFVCNKVSAGSGVKGSSGVFFLDGGSLEYIYLLLIIFFLPLYNSQRTRTTTHPGV
jgi:hypothetical protein